MRFQQVGADWMWTGVDQTNYHNNRSFGDDGWVQSGMDSL